MRPPVCAAGLALALLAAAACGGGDDGASPDARTPADAATDAMAPDAAPPDAAPPDAAPPDAGPLPPFEHPTRLAFSSGGIPYVTEWRDGVARPPVALSDSPVGDRIAWAPDGRTLLILGATLSTVGFDDLGPLPLETLASECATECRVDDAGWSPDGRHLWIKSSAEPMPPSTSPLHYLDVVAVAADGSFGERHRLTPDPSPGDVYPLAAWSPDSRSLLWASTPGDTEAQLHVTRVHGATSPVASHTVARTVT